MDTGLLLDGIQHHGGVHHLADGTRAAGAVSFDAVPLTDVPVLEEQLLKFFHMLRTDFAGAEGICSEIDAVAYPVDDADSVLL